MKECKVDTRSSLGCEHTHAGNPAHFTEGVGEVPA